MVYYIYKNTQIVTWLQGFLEKTIKIKKIKKIKKKQREGEKEREREREREREKEKILKRREK